MNLVTPEIGLLFWQVVVFLVVLIVLRSYAWKPIMSGIKERESKITDALEAAKEAEVRMKEINKRNDELERESREQKDKILKEAKSTAESIVHKAKDEAIKEAEELVFRAKQEIERERKAAAESLKNEVAQLSIEIAERMIRKELRDKESHNALVNEYLSDNSLV